MTSPYFSSCRAVLALERPTTLSEGAEIRGQNVSVCCGVARLGPCSAFHLSLLLKAPAMSFQQIFVNVYAHSWIWFREHHAASCCSPLNRSGLFLPDVKRSPIQRRAAERKLFRKKERKKRCVEEGLLVGRLSCWEKDAG